MPSALWTPSLRVGERDDGRALVGEDERQVGADVAEALDGDSPALDRQILLPQRLADAERSAARGRLDPPHRAAHLERLPGDDAEHRVALVHRVRVEDPGHLARARAHVGRGNVGLRPDEVDDLGRVAARHPLQLGDGELLRVRRRRRPSRPRTEGP